MIALYFTNGYNCLLISVLKILGFWRQKKGLFMHSSKVFFKTFYALFEIVL